MSYISEPMKEFSMDCPKCDDELRFEIESHDDGHGKWYQAGLIEGDKNCACEFSDDEITALESEAVASYVDGLGYDY